MTDDVNETHLAGELDETPELRTTRSETKVCNPTIITRRSYTDRSGEDRESVEFHRCVCWGGLAEKAAETAAGARVEVSGRLQTRTWEDSDGQKRTTTEIVASSFEVTEEPERTESGTLGGDSELPF